METFVLASGSPRRKDLLNKAGQRFSVFVPCVKEKEGGLLPEELVRENAVLKARAAFEHLHRPVLCADTVVSFMGEILGKPHGEEQAREYLTALSGNTHQVYSGVCVKTADGEKAVVVKTDVKMKRLSPAFIEEYIRAGKPFDKAGGYGMQDGGFVESLFGSETNVIGLPMEETEKLLKEFSLWQETV